MFHSILHRGERKRPSLTGQQDGRLRRAVPTGGGQSASVPVNPGAVLGLLFYEMGASLAPVFGAGFL
jgi:hypothetical protein